MEETGRIDDTPLARAYRENRIRVLSVSTREIVGLFRDQRKHLPDAVAFPFFADIPEDYEVKAAYVNYMHNAIDFLVVHPSFDPVPLNEMAPSLRPLVGAYFARLVHPEQESNV